MILRGATSRGFTCSGVRASNAVDVAPRDYLSPLVASVSSSTGGAGVSPSMAVIFDFTSAGVSYTSKTSTALTAKNNATWIIEGVNVGINPGVVALSGNKTLRFIADPPACLTAFNCNTNTLSGSFPEINNCVNLTTFDVGVNSITGSVCSLLLLTSLQNFACSSNAGLGGAFPSLANCAALLTLSCRSCAFTGSPPSIAANPLVTSVDFALNAFTGSIPAFGANTALTTYNCRTCTTISGNIPSLSGCTSLASFFAYDNALTGVVGGFAVPATLTDFEAQNNLLTQAAVDAILAAFVTAGASGAYILNVGGTGNAAPSAGGATSKTTLQGRGWTVTTN